ncbi:MAG: hypothetical protein FWC20_07725 [Oscillospiraceae bacterium]|nr:hypothetical protein [Oscillospiraceae bacterium]MCL2279278.1 hypothetical protein [Oscillospiraceae bacterium]
MNIFISVALGIVSSIIASSIFWLLAFKVTRTKVKFYENLEKSKNTGEYPGDFRYRVKVMNIGIRDFIEVEFICRLTIKRKNGVQNYTYLGVGNADKIPVLKGRKNRCKKCDKKSTKGAHTLTLYCTSVTNREFSKKFYAESVKEKAGAEELSLDDILNEYFDTATITIYAYGYDAVTGARKMYVSQPYKFDDIKST